MDNFSQFTLNVAILSVIGFAGVAAGIFFLSDQKEGENNHHLDGVDFADEIYDVPVEYMEFPTLHIKASPQSNNYFVPV